MPIWGGMRPTNPTRALSIRQPFAELILRGIKTIEYRSRPTSLVGERFYIYAAKAKARPALPRQAGKGGVWSTDLSDEAPPPWMLELAEALRLWGPDAELPRGVIVGSAVIEKVTGPADGHGRYQWHLTDVKRARQLRRPTGHPQPVWFQPFKAA